MNIKELIEYNLKNLNHQDARNVLVAKITLFENCYKHVKNYDSSKYVSYLINITNNLYPQVNTLYYWLFFLSKKQPQHIEKFLFVLNKVVEQGVNGGVTERFGNDLITCLKRFPDLINDDFYKNFVDYIIPQAKTGNSIFAFRGTRWFDDKYQKGGTGPADFGYKCYAMPFCTAGLHELIQMYKEVPAGNFETFEQIRKDAILIGHRGPFGAILGDLIHNSDLNIQSLIKEMLEYKRTLDRNPLDNIQNKLQYKIETVYNIDNYEQICENGEKVLIVLQRLNNNLNNTKLYTPKFTEYSLGEDIIALDKKLSMQTLENLLKKINTYILTRFNKQIGMSPEFVQLCVWADHKIFEFLNRMDFETQFGLNTSSCFREILVFNELLNNPESHMNKEEFNKFYNENILGEPTEIAFRAVAKRQNELAIKLNRLHDELMQKYAIDSSIISNRKQRIWSGNMFSALQRLLPYKEASTIVGRRYKKEREQLDRHLYSVIKNWNSLMK